MKIFFKTILFVAAFGTPLLTSAAYPELPRVYMDTTYSPPGGRVISVPAGGDFQGALNSANLGDEIVLTAGATYTGGFTLPNKTSGSGWIIIRSSNMSGLPPEGTRVNPSNSSAMPKIVANQNNDPALSAAPGAHHYRIMGLEITVASDSVWQQGGLISLGDGQNSLSDLPHDIIIDRSYIHGTDNGFILRRGIMLNSRSTAIVDSYISNWHETGSDSQAIAGWNGSGPFKIVNNYLEGAGENVMFGGADPSIVNLIPSDIEIRRNYFFKRPSWKGNSSFNPIKNLFELKNAQRVLVDGNIFENNWGGQGQSGFGIVFTPRNQDGGAPWSTIQDITFTNNIVKHSGAGINYLGTDDTYPSGITSRITVENNIFDDLYESHAVQITGGIDIKINHNTFMEVGNMITAYGDAINGFVLTNNFFAPSSYGVYGDAIGIGSPAKTQYFPTALLSRNIFTGQDAGSYTNFPAFDNFFPANPSAVGFINYNNGNGGDYRLSASSPYNNAGTDGRDIGADIDVVMAATAGATSGSGGTPPPPSTKKGDLNNDSKVDVIDLGIFLSNWGKTTKPPADINQDSRVDVIDLGILLSNWG